MKRASAQADEVVGNVRSCMRDRIRNELVTRIVDGIYAPGTHLKELALAHEFNVSQAPVREALRELEVLGLVESERYRGTRVRAVTPTEMREAYELRARLEEAAAELAVPIAADTLDELQAEVDELLRAAKRGDMETYARHNVNFHRLIVAASGNRILLRVWDSLGWEVRSRVAVRIVAGRKEFVSAAASHGPILDALRAHDGKRAGRLLREHSESFLGEAEKMDAAGGVAKPKPARKRATGRSGA